MGTAEKEQLFESRSLVAVALIDLVIRRALSVQFRDTQIKYCRINHVGAWPEAAEPPQDPDDRWAVSRQSSKSPDCWEGAAAEGPREL